MYIHIKACFWYFIADYNELWEPYLEWEYEIHGNESHFYEQSILSRYLMIIYNQIIMLRRNEMGPRTTIEIVIMNLMLIMDLIIAGNIFG
jgi:hypothetical protein